MRGEADHNPARVSDLQFDGRRYWQRTSFRRPDGSVEFSKDDLTLYDASRQPIARIYRYAFGPNAGRWCWLVLGLSESLTMGGTGVVASEEEARKVCEGFRRDD
jgi:hypothetical protein